MNTVVLAFRYLWSRPLVALLNLLLLTLGLASITFVVLVSSQVNRSFERDLQGIDLVVGAKGSPMQMILSGLFQIDTPPPGVPLADLQDLSRNPLVDKLIPLALGDSYHGWRLVGTTASYFAHYGTSFEQGGAWERPMDAVLGAQVARSAQLVLGDKFAASHGLGNAGPDHNSALFRVSGILAPCGCVADRLVLTGIESVWRLHEKPAVVPALVPAAPAATQPMASAAAEGAAAAQAASGAGAGASGAGAGAGSGAGAGATAGAGAGAAAGTAAGAASATASAASKPLAVASRPTGPARPAPTRPAGAAVAKPGTAAKPLPKAPGPAAASAPAHVPVVAAAPAPVPAAAPAPVVRPPGAAEADRAARADTRDVTMALVTFKTPAAATRLPREINSSPRLQAAAPAAEVARLLKLMGVGLQALRGLGAVLLAAAALSVFIALWNAVRERRADLAMLRMLGATPARVAALLLCEALWLAVLAALIGLLAGHAITAVLGEMLQAERSLPVTGWLWVPAEGWIAASAVGVAAVAALIPAATAWRIDVGQLLNAR